MAQDDQLSWLIRLKVHTLLVNSRNSSLDIVLALPSDAFLLKVSLQNTKMYSWVSLRVGLEGERQLPHAVDGLAPDALSHIISPLIRKPSPRASCITYVWSGMYGFLPRFATFMQALPPGTRTR